VSDYYRKMKCMGDLSCTVSDCNLILNILQRLNKRYDHLRAIITCNTSFPSFHKVQDDLVLEELMLAPLPHAFYSNNTPAPPLPAPFCPPCNGS
jgi:hypothetical protein